MGSSLFLAAAVILMVVLTPDDDLWAEFLEPKGADVWTPLPQLPACFCLENTGAFVTSTDSPEKKVMVGSRDSEALVAFHLADQGW
ncbi:hypothetical protein RHMOL_Rhmol05G0066300 [Rhododendron molle]|uniref:Uncharacterized protein n=1 Tax=Rhododendron molle TaxID=49168 RepID=A0ACC0NN84_RHOML|nr:hypothetical protein RHMOL_Rhmol05G0066300 [Rhododendron molle]